LAVQLLGQDARNQDTKDLVSPTPEIKMGDLLLRSPAVALVVASLALKVLPAGLPLRCPAMS
jgi:hypothetical protein